MTGWTRRSVGAAGLGLAAAPSVGAAAVADPLSGERLWADVVNYAMFGDHRTGTAGDLPATCWPPACWTTSWWRPAMRCSASGSTSRFSI